MSYFDRRQSCRHIFEWATWRGDHWQWNCSECGKDFHAADHLDCTRCVAHPDVEPAPAY
jgi:hypothetical protein